MMSDSARKPIAVVTVVATVGALGAGAVVVGVDIARGALADANASALVAGNSGAPHSGGGLGHALEGVLGGGVQPTPTQPRQRHTESSSPTEATARQSVGVVDITTTLRYANAKAAGTGMILTSNGEVLTNNHVVSGATSIKVTVVTTGRSYTAKVVGTDANDDVAVLQMSGASGLSTVKTDTTSVVRVGDSVTGVGNARGKGGTPTAARGNVIAINKTITTRDEFNVKGERLSGLIEVRADIVSGDSGGPLYDTDNEVAGMDTAASSGQANVTGYAIPIRKALTIANAIENGSTAGGIKLGNPAFLGVSISDVGAFAPGGPTNGALVGGVYVGTPAANAGLTAGDVITRVDSHRISSSAELSKVIASYKPGAAVRIAWTDQSGTPHIARVTLIEGPAA
jgi:S1-C subfamily serine protease